MWESLRERNPDPGRVGLVGGEESESELELAALERDEVRAIVSESRLKVDTLDEEEGGQAEVRLMVL